MAAEVKASRQAGSAVPLGRAFGALAWHAMMALAAWAETARERRHLQELDDRLLKDIGVTRSDVERECSKPFWR